MNQAIDLVFVQRAALRQKKETSKGYETDARQLCVDLDNPRVENIRLDDVERYLAKMLKAGFARNALIHKACAFRTFFKTLRRHGYIVLNPEDIPIPRKEFKEPRVATDEQIAKVLEAIDKSPITYRSDRNRAALLLLRDTGMRLGELLALDVDDLDLERKTAVIQTKKSRGMRPVRTVFWYDECNDALKKWIATRETFLKKRRSSSEKALFIGSHRDAGRAYRLKQSAIEIAFRKLSWVAGVAGLNPHSLRHRKGHMLATQGANNSIISGVLGHSSLSSSYIYTMMNDKELEKMARTYGGEK